MNEHTIITGTVDMDELYENRKSGAATTFKDRNRRMMCWIQTIVRIMIMKVQ
ncbi:MAG: hypothetical protein ACQEW5_18565 [Bacillota bacterium]